MIRWNFFNAGTKPDVTTETQKEANKGIALVTLIVKGDFQQHMYFAVF